MQPSIYGTLLNDFNWTACFWATVLRNVGFPDRIFVSEMRFLLTITMSKTHSNTPSPDCSRRSIRSQQGPENPGRQ
jgi:hypothetical protein